MHASTEIPNAKRASALRAQEEGTGVEEEGTMFLCQVQRDHWVLVRRREHQLLTQLRGRD